MSELEISFDKYVKVCNEIDAYKDAEIKRLQGIIDRMETTIQLMERSLNNKETAA